MPLIAVNDTLVTQRCAGCGALRPIARTGLSVGAVAGPGGLITLEGIRLPVCPECQSEEFLFCTPELPEHPAPGSFGHRHRLLVNHLVAALARAGQVHPGLTEDESRALRAAASPETEQALRQWFPGGLEMPSGLEAELPAPLRSRAQAPRGAEVGQ